MIDYPKIMAMIEHWLESEINGYFGSDYGPDFNSILLAPLSAPVANNFIEKMKSDIPILKQLSADQLQLWSQDEGFETKVIYLRVGNQIAMIEHWLESEINGYFGSDYGPDFNSILLAPLSAPVANNFIEKMKSDIPILKQLSADQLQLWSRDEGFETKVIYLQVGNQIAINLNQVRDMQLSRNGETYDVDAS